MKLELMDYFIQRIQELFDAPHSLAIHLFKRWNAGRFASKQEIDAFLGSKVVFRAVFPVEEINLLKRYKRSELEALGAKLILEDPAKHIFSDAEFGYRWQQVYHGPGDAWLDLFSVVEPQMDDAEVVQAANT